MNYALILSGGSGTRLWPLSRRSHPKHLISLMGEDPLLEQTLDRLDELIPPEQRYLITIPEQAPIVRDVARGKAVGIVIEPAGRNNLLPMALLTKFLADRDPDACIAFLPADHSILEPEKLREALDLAFKVARHDYIVTLGIHTRHPETNYGHVQRGDEIPGFNSDEFDVFTVKSFREKPPIELAEEYHSGDDWFWNGGIFIFAASTMLRLIEKAQPDLARMLNELEAVLSVSDPQLDRPVIDWEASEEIRDAYLNLRPGLRTSIDYALMEKAERVATIPIEMGWNDLGGFSALCDLIEPDENGNRICKGNQEYEQRVLNPGCKNVNIMAGKRAVVCLDCDDLIVIDTPDAVLILPRSSSARVGEVVARIRQHGWNDLL